MRVFGKRERRSGGKDLERQPLTVWIQGCQAYENTPFSTNEGCPYLKNPRSKALEPDCLSLRRLIATQSQGGREKRGGLFHDAELVEDPVEHLFGGGLSNQISKNLKGGPDVKGD